MDAHRLALHDPADNRRDTAEQIPEFKIRNDLPAEFKQELKSILFRLQLLRVIDSLSTHAVDGILRNLYPVFPPRHKTNFWIETGRQAAAEIPLRAHGHLR